MVHLYTLFHLILPIIHGITKSQTRLRDSHFTSLYMNMASLTTYLLVRKTKDKCMEKT